MSEPKASYAIDKPAKCPAQQNESDAAIAAIVFALKCGTSDGGMEFLNAWNEGNFDVIRDEWPDAPEAVYFGTDPLHPLTSATEIMKGNVVITGDQVFAGIDQNDLSTCKNALVIEFSNLEQLRNAVKRGQVKFSMFEKQP